MALARFQADNLLDALIGRAWVMNESLMPFRVVALVVFGSYLSGISVLGDLNVAVWIVGDNGTEVTQGEAFKFLCSDDAALSLVPVVEKDLIRQPINVALFEFD